MSSGTNVPPVYERDVLVRPCHCEAGFCQSSPLDRFRICREDGIEMAEELNAALDKIGMLQARLMEARDGQS